MAGQQDRKHLVRTFVLTDVAAPSAILGFYTLSAGEVEGGNLDGPRKHPARVPVIRLGRFAVHKNLQGLGLGKDLLLNALERVAETAGQIGIAAVVVDAKEGKAGFYRHYGFVPSRENPLRLFLPTATLLRLLAK
jgi:GNAT superfamily N-acetyltransferase